MRGLLWDTGSCVFRVSCSGVVSVNAEVQILDGLVVIVLVLELFLWKFEM